MSVQLILNIIAVVFILVNILFTYMNFLYNRKKDYQDKLFQYKADAYKLLIDASYAAVKRLDINSIPYAQIYDFTDKDKWLIYCEQNMGTEIIEGFNLRDLVYEQVLFLPTTIIAKFYNFSNDCISFVKSAYNFETEIIVENQDKLWNSYIELLSAVRKDLKIDTLDIGLKRRI